METGVAFAKLDPDGDDRFQRHEHQEEVYLVIEGVLTLVIEGEPRELRRGELVRVAPDVRRQLVNRHSAPLLILAAGGAHEHVGRDGRAYHGWDETGEGHPPAETPPAEDVPLA